MSLKALSRKVDQLHHRVVPPPRVIDVTGVKEKLLAMLEQQIIAEGGYLSEEETEWTEEELEIYRQLGEILDEQTRHEQEAFNIRFICRNETTGMYETC